MSTGFEANVSKKKPRTRLTAMVQTTEPEVEDETETAPRTERTKSRAKKSRIQARLKKQQAEAPPLEAGSTPKSKRASSRAPASSEPQINESRERLEALKARLAASDLEFEAHTPTTHSLEDIRETVLTLKRQLEETRARSEELQTDLNQTTVENKELRRTVQAETVAKAKAETTAKSQHALATALARESETLKEERDEALRTVADYQRVDDEHSKTLSLLEQKLELRDQAIQDLRGELEGTQETLRLTTREFHQCQRDAKRSQQETDRLRRELSSLEKQLSQQDNTEQALVELRALLRTV